MLEPIEVAQPIIPKNCYDITSPFIVHVIVHTLYCTLVVSSLLNSPLPAFERPVMH